jgi:hypothetical protein
MDEAHLIGMAEPFAASVGAFLFLHDFELVVNVRRKGWEN